MPHPDRGHAGFTLLELVVALTITGMVVLGSRAVLARLGDDAKHLADIAADDAARANADRLLRDLLGRAEMSLRGRPRFTGDSRGLRFTASCDVPAGWQEPCEVEIGLVEVDGVATLGVTLSTGEALVLRRGVHVARLRYLYDPGDGGTWVNRWDSAISLPRAVGVEIDGELAILPIGERG